MSYNVTYNDQIFALEENETILDCLLREKVSIAYSCKAGACQTCLMQASVGEVPASAQAGLKDTLKERNMFLSCQCVPQNDLVIKAPDDTGLRTTGKLIDISMLNHDVYCLRIEQTFQSEDQPPLNIEPGQFISLINSEGTARSYSVANNPQTDNYIELHVRCIPAGKMGKWLKSVAQINDEVQIQGPAGDCFYASGTDNSASLYLAGTSTGLAPLYGIVKQALAKEHKGNITLLHGVLNEPDLYLVEDLQKLSAVHNNFEYIACVLNAGSDTGKEQGDIQQSLLSRLKEPQQTDKLFLCGAPDLINSLKTRAFIAGLASKNIHADPFIPSDI